MIKWAKFFLIGAIMLHKKIDFLNILTMTFCLLELFSLPGNLYSFGRLFTMNTPRNIDDIKSYYGTYIPVSFKKGCVNKNCIGSEVNPNYLINNKSSILISKNKYINHIIMPSNDGYVIEDPIYVREKEQDNSYSNNKVFYVYGRIKGFPYHDNMNADKLRVQIDEQVKNKNYVAMILIDNNGNLIEQQGTYNFFMQKK